MTDKLIKKSSKIINKKTILILTFVLYILAMMTFEIAYCNAENLGDFILRTSEIKYNFSLCRIVIYIIFLIVLYLTRNIFIEDALKSYENKYKRVMTYIYFPIILIITIIALFIIKFNPISFIIRGMSIGIITLFMVGIALLYISNNAVKNIIVINLSVGFVFAITTEFNNTVDEKKHFMSAFNMSFGNFNYIEEPITDTEINKLNHLTKFTHIDEFLNKKYSPNITTEVDMNDIPSTPAGNNPVLYSFAALGIFVARIIGGSIIDLYIMGRIFNLIFFTILSCIAIKLIPYKKNIFMTIFLMPMTILFAASYSADGFCIGIIAILIAYCLKLKEQKRAINIKEFAILVVLFGLTLLAKSMSYVLVGIILLMLPIKETLKKYKKYMPIIITIVVIVCLIIGGLILYIATTKLTADNRAVGTVSISGQVLNLIENPLLAIKVILFHIKNTFLNFDWYVMLHDKVFFTENAKHVMLPMLIFILYVALTEDDYNFAIKDKIISLISFFGVYLMTSMVFYVAFTEVGGTYIAGYQTRYILPILPLALFTISNKKTLSQNDKNRTMNIAMVMGVFIVIGIIQEILV